MSVETSVSVYGIKDALKALNKVAPMLRREVTKDYKEIVSSVVKDAQNAIPEIAPMSGMDGGWRTQSGYDIIPQGGWNGIKAQKLVSAKISTRKVKMYQGTSENVGTFRVVWTGLANSAFDIAGRKSNGTVKQRSRMGSHGKRVGTVGGAQMIAVLNSRYNRASRAMWPAWEKNKTEVDAEMQKLCDRVMKSVNQQLVTGDDLAGFSMEQ